MASPLAQPIRPSRVWYVIALGLFAFGIASGVAAWQYFAGLFKNIERVLIPGGSIVRLAEPGTYTVMQESRSVFDGRVFDVPASSVPPISIAIQTADGVSLSVAPSTSDVTYSFPRYAGVSIAEFTIGEPGDYTIAGAYEGADGPQVVLAITKNPGSRIVGGLGKLFLAGFLGFIAAITALITVFRRFRARRRLQGPPTATPATTWR